MTRLSAPERESLPADAQAIWDRIAATRISGTMRGPSAVMMHAPELAARVMEVEDYFRTSAELSDVDREFVILATVREWGARFAWARHEERGRQVNLRPEAIEALRQQGPLDRLTPREQTLGEVVRTLLRTHDLPDDLYRRALEELGQTQLVEAFGLIGNYCTIALFIKAFEIPEDSPTF